MKQKENRKIRYTKKVIQDSLMELMKDRSILKITVKDICALADISRSTFYDHYKDQYDLLQQIEEETLTYITDLLNRFEGKYNKQGLTEMLEELLNCIANNNAFQVLFSEYGDLDFQSKLFKRHFTLHKQLAKNFYGKMHDEETVACYFIFTSNGTSSLIQYWLKNNMHIPVPQLAKMIVKWTTGQ